MDALLEAGADAGQVIPLPDDMTTKAAFVAAASGNLEMLKLVLKFRASAKDVLNGSPLLVAAILGRGGNDVVSGAIK
jgi:hypothetical protein